MAASDGTYVLRLFVAGERAQSLEARKNIEQICEGHLQGRCELTVFDVCKDFMAAQDHGVLLTPTLLLLSPLPRVTIVGSLNDTRKVLAALRLGGANR
jgi:circadian clock protein KaiB